MSSRSIEIPRLLYRGTNAAARDRADFNLWANGHITTEECIKRFRENNFIGDTYGEVSINEEDFAKFLVGMGYRRIRG